MKRLLNKVALVTGGCGAIGIETAKLFLREGATVIIADVLDEAGQSFQTELGVDYYRLDVSLDEEWRQFVTDFSKKYRQLDVLFNNAGIFGFSEIISEQNPEVLSLDDWQHIQHVNLDSVFLGCKYGIQLMKKCGGSIINMSSRAGLIGVPYASAYAASKAAIANYTKSVALYCAEKKYSIRCNSLHPGIIQTHFWAPIFKTEEEMTKKMSDAVPMGYLGAAHNVACAALYLASDESSYVTGTEMIVDGGLSAGHTTNPIS